jgi:hypothetical protein
MLFCSTRVECIAWLALLDCGWGGMGFYLTVLFLGVSPTKHCGHDHCVYQCSSLQWAYYSSHHQIAQCCNVNSMSGEWRQPKASNTVTPFSPPLLSCTCCSRFHEVCVILFHDLFLQISLYWQYFFAAGWISIALNWCLCYSGIH